MLYAEDFVFFQTTMSVQMAPSVMLMQNVKIYLVRTGALVTQDTKGLV